jgi:hypothetical protein
MDPEKSFLENIYPVPFLTYEKTKAIASLPFATTQGEKGNALEKALPAVFREKIRDRYKTEDGYQLDASGRKIPYLRTDEEKDSLALKVGITSLAEGMSKDMYYATVKRNKKTSEIKRENLQKLQRLYVDAYLRDTKSEESREKGRELFNKLVKDYGMQPDEIKSFLMNAQDDFVTGGNLAIQYLNALEQEDFEKYKAIRKVDQKTKLLQERYAK